MYGFPNSILSMRWDKVRPKTLEAFKRVEAALKRGEDIYIACKNNKLSAHWFRKMRAAQKEIQDGQKVT